MKILIACKKCNENRFVETRGMLKETYEKQSPHCHKCAFNKKISSKYWFKKGLIPWNKGKNTGIDPWNKGIKGLTKRNEGSFKKGVNKDNKNVMWKGEDVGYYALHQYLYRNFGKPKCCKFCGNTNKVQWASKNYRYTRKIEDYISLCYWCHRKYDVNNGWGNAIIKFPHMNI